MNIYQRINAVQKQVKYIKKDSVVSTGSGSYQAVSHDNVISELRGHLIEQGILVIPSLVSSEWFEPRKGKEKSTNWLYTAEFLVRFQNMDEASDCFELRVAGHANDSGDKAAGKAQSYAVKTALLKVFALETGVDDESRAFDPSEYTPEQKATFDELLEAEDAFGYHCFIQSLPEPLRRGLHNSFEIDKTKQKKKCRDLGMAGAEAAQNIVDEIKSRIDANDPSVLELTDEMELFEKQHIVKRIRKGDVEYLSKLSKGI